MACAFSCASVRRRRGRASPGSGLTLRAAPAEGGKANAALVKLLAREWGVAPSRIGIVAGAKDRRKTVHVAGDTPALVERLKKWIEKQNV